jgi:alpha-2-macroglobulin
MARTARNRMDQRGMSKLLLAGINLIVIFSIACSGLGVSQAVEAAAVVGDESQPTDAAFDSLAQTAAPLRAVDVLPRPDSSDVDPESAVVVTFDQPVVPLMDDGSTLPAAFNIQPVADGYAEWLNTSTYIFYPDPPLAGGVDYQVSLNTDLTSTAGAALATGDGEISKWSFLTASPRMESLFPDAEEGAIDLDQEFELVFNQRMDADSVQENLLLQDLRGNDVPGDFAWEEDNTLLTFAPSQLMSRDTAYKLTLRGQAASAGGTRLGESAVQIYTTVSIMDVASTYPAEDELMDGYFGYNNLRLEMTAPPDPYQKLPDLVKISPSISNIRYTVTEADRRIYIAGNFEPNQQYTVTISPDLKDRWGQPMAGERQLLFRTAPLPAGLFIPMLQAGQDTMTFMPDQTSLTAQATNVGTVYSRSAQLSLETFFALDVSYYNQWEEESIPDVESWQVNLDLLEDSTTVVDLPLAPDQQALPTGVYYFDFQVPEIEKNFMEPHPFLAVVSPFNLMMKRSVGEVFLWAVDLRSETPAAGKEFIFYDEWMNPVAQAVTGADGSCRIALPDYFDPSMTVFAVTGQPGNDDFGLVSDAWTYETSAWYFGMGAWPREDSRQTYVYTDRPIYRPGHTVNFRVVMRDEEGGGYAAPPSGQVEARIYHDDMSRQEIGMVPLSLSSYGTASGEILLPEDATPGTYTLAVSDEVRKTRFHFQVANYRKPEIDLQVDFNKEDWQMGEDLTANVQADYYFGAPAGGVELWWTLYSKGNDFGLPYEYRTGSRMISWMASDEELYYYDPELGKEITRGTAKTTADGSLEFDISSEEILNQIDAENLQTLTLQVSVVDDDEMQVSASGTATLHPASFYIGVRSEAWVGQAGVESGFRIQTTDWEQKPSSEHVLQAQFQKISWEQADPSDWSMGAERQPVFSTVSSADLLTDGQGRARLAFVPPEAGTYVLKVFGGGAVTETMLWVSGSQGARWPNLPNQELPLTSDKSAYRPGEVARILIPNSFGGKTLALITVEREKVLYAEVVEIDGGAYQWELSLTDNFAPNIFVAVTLLGKEGEAVPAFRQGYLELAVEPVAQTLEVELLTTPTRSEPGGEVSFDIQVRDSFGQPAQGEFSIAVVDKAVLALADSEAPDILEAFYSPRTLRVNNSMSLSLSANRIPLISIDGRGGGGGGPQSVQPALREDFEDTALWQGSVETDSFGIAKVTMTLPDNLTTWVADLRGITRDTKVGSAGSEIVVSKPLLIRPQTPRFFVAGDHTALRAVVHNNTPQELNVDVSLQAVGVALDDGTISLQQITLAAGDRQTVTWWGTVQETDEVGLVFQAVSGSLQDAARPEQGVLPVLSYQVPASYVTAGVLADAGEQLETIQMPTSFTPVGGDLQVEMSPSLAATVINEMEVLKAFPYDFTEPLVSHLLPNLEMVYAVKELGLEIPGLESELQEEIEKSLSRLLRYQNKDGGWGWMSGRDSDDYITAYVLFGLGRASQVGVYVPPEQLLNAENFLRKVLVSPEEISNSWQLDRLVFQYFALTQVSDNPLDLETLYAQRDSLNPWAKALLALMINRENVADKRGYDLLSNLESTAKRSASGAHWEDSVDTSRYNFSSAHFNTAVVTYATALMDPASALLRDGMRYLVTQRADGGGWASSYEAAWVLMGLTEAMKATSDFDPRYSYEADLNGQTLLSGGVDGGNRLTALTSFVPLLDLQQQALNELRISRDEGSGNLYYRAILNLERPAEEAGAEQNGLSITRSYHGVGEACTMESCPMIESMNLGSEGGVAEVQLTLTLPTEMSYLIVEDFIPAGSEIINPQLKTSQATEIQYDPRNPFGGGWGWWYFNQPQVYDDHVRWIGRRVPAGTYVLTYHIQAMQAGEYRTLPAHSYEYYFPDVRGNTAGGLFEIE